MWTCTLCNRSFKNTHQTHYCGDKTIGDFLTGKNEVVIELFDYFIFKFEEIGPIKLHVTKSMIVISANVGFAYVINLGKNFIDIVFPFKELFATNLCFRKMASVPGSNDYNHHLRLYLLEDVNEEVIYYMKKAYVNGKNL